MVLKIAAVILKRSLNITEDSTRKDSNLMEVDDDVSDGESPSPPPNTRIVRILSTPDLESREGEAEEGPGDHQETREGGDHTLESRVGLCSSSAWVIDLGDIT